MIVVFYGKVLHPVASVPAVNFLAKGIHDAVEEGTDRNEGICFETYLYELADVK